MAVMIEARSFRPFKSSEEYLYAMKEDLAEWLNTLYPELMINVENFMDRLDTGVALCRHANNVRQSAADHEERRISRGLTTRNPPLPPVSYLPAARPGTFFARDNVSNFITWCRGALGIFECLLFETDDLIMRKNEKHVILCLLEVARKGSKFGMLAPMLVQMERQIDREILADARRSGQGGAELDDEDDEEPAAPMVYGPVPQIITNDLKSLDEMVRELVERCNCPTQFPMIRVSEGKYRIGDTKVLIFVRILRSHVMVRVGGGWDTLSHYLDKHDPCRCKSQHRTTHAARLVHKYNAQGMDLTGAEVHYDRSPPRTRRSSVSSVGSSGGGSPQHHPVQLGPPQHTAARQRSRSPAPPSSDRSCTSLPYMGNNAFENHAFNHLAADNAYLQSKYNRRSISPSPARKPIQHRAPSPNPQRKHMQNPVYSPSHVFGSPALVSSETLVPQPHKNNRSRSPTPRSAQEIKRVVSPDKEMSYFTDPQASDNAANGSENASDNGSEVSDEGYRSLGVIQNSSGGSTQTSPPGTGIDTKEIVDKCLGLKLNRLSLNSQTSGEDADVSERPDITPVSEASYKRQISPSECGSQMSTTEDRFSDDKGSVDKISLSRLLGSPREEVSSATGLRKTNYSETLYGDKKPIDRNRDGKMSLVCIDGNDAPSQSLQRAVTSTRIPQSPILNRRRLSMENLSNGRSRSGSRDRTMMRENSMTRDPLNKFYPKTSKPPVPVTGQGSLGKTSGAKASSNNTWNGRTPLVKGKPRPGIATDTYSPPGTKTPSNKVASPPFQRNSNLRSSTSALKNVAGYDHNGRRVKQVVSPPQSSQSKKQHSSPLLEKILKSAEHAHDDAMMLEKMKEIIKQYSNLTDQKVTGPGEFTDFTSAWVHSNGTLERSQSSRQLRDSLNNYSPNESPSGESSLRSAALVSKIPMFSPRRDSKMGVNTSRIPAPVSVSSYKKSPSFYD